MRRIRTILLLLLLLVSIRAVAAEGAVVGAGVPARDLPSTATFAPTSHYETRQIEGWRVRILKTFIKKNSALCSPTLKLLEGQLAEIDHRLPAPAVARLRQVTIWVEEREPHHPCMAYHPSRRWLSEHGMNPDKGRCVEIANARNFISWTIDQPAMVLHELAHAYMDQFLDAAENGEIRAAYDKALKGGIYSSVLQIRGRNERAYAMNNEREYFAESTEALFGTNDFYPFVRAELKRHDPACYELLNRLWRKSANQ